MVLDVVTIIAVANDLMTLQLISSSVNRGLSRGKAPPGYSNQYHDTHRCLHKRIQETERLG